MKFLRLNYSIIIVLAFALGACAPSTPPPSVGDPQALVSTIIAATVQALPTATLAPTTPAPTPTRSDALISTEVAGMLMTPTSIPTLTPMLFPSMTPNSTLPPGVLGADRPLYACKEVVFSPKNGTRHYPLEVFEMNWKIENIGSEVWKEKDSKFVFLGGDKIYKDEPEREFGYSVYPDARIKLRVMIQSPHDPGRYSSAWGLKVNDLLVCSMQMYFDVIPRPPSPTPTPRNKK